VDRTITYTNNAGETLVFGVGSKWRYADNDLFQASLEYESANNRVISFDEALVEHNITVNLRTSNTAGMAERNRIMDVAQADIVALSPGTLSVGDSFTRAYITGCKPDQFHYRDGFMDMELTIVRRPYWLREYSQTIVPESRVGLGGMDYPTDYPYDYMSTYSDSNTLTNPFSVPAKPVFYIGGACENPTLSIAGNTYEVQTSIDNGELIIVDALERTIVTRDKFGNETSIFDKGVRGEGCYIFQSIPAGTSNVIWDGSYPVEVKLYEERRVPYWN
jgi:hypothetical protein